MRIFGKPTVELSPHAEYLRTLRHIQNGGEPRTPSIVERVVNTVKERGPESARAVGLVVLTWATLDALPATDAAVPGPIDVGEYISGIAFTDDQTADCSNYAGSVYIPTECAGDPVEIMEVRAIYEQMIDGPTDLPTSD